MATGTAEEALHPTNENANFLRLTRLLMRGGLQLLRDTFNAIHSPPNLSTVLDDHTTKTALKTLKRKRVLTQTQWKYLYDPHGPGTYGESANFDISLLCLLLQEICELPEPSKGWFTFPEGTDNSCGADVVRIRHYRNTLYGHNQSMEIANADFKKLWKKIREVLLRIAGRISIAKRKEWEKEIDEFLYKPLTPDAQENVEQLRLWYKDDLKLKEMVEEIKEDVKQMKINNEQILINQEKIIMNQELLLMSINVIAAEVEGRGSSVSPYFFAAPQAQVAHMPYKNEETQIPIPPDQSSVEDTPTGPSTSTELQGSQQNHPHLWSVICSNKKLLKKVEEYLKSLGVDLHDFRQGSLIITVSCSSLEVLEALWKDYRTRHLNKVIQDTLVTAEVLEKLDLNKVELRTIISEEDYTSYKHFLNYRQGMMNCIQMTLANINSFM